MEMDSDLHAVYGAAARGCCCCGGSRRDAPPAYSATTVPPSASDVQRMHASVSTGTLVGMGAADLVMTMIIVPTHVLFFWRGLWQLLDLYWYPGWVSSSDPDDLERTLWLSLGLGWCLTAVLFILSRANASPLHLSKTKTSSWRWLYERLFYTATAFACVCVWRGLWYFQDAYILPEDEKASAWLTFGLGTAFSLVLLGTRSLNAPPTITAVDGDFSQPIFIPSYIEVLHSRRRARASRQASSAAAAAAAAAAASASPPASGAAFENGKDLCGKQANNMFPPSGEFEARLLHDSKFQGLSDAV